MHARLITILTAMALSGGWTSALAQTHPTSGMQDAHGSAWRQPDSDAAKARKDLASAQQSLHETVRDISVKTNPGDRAAVAAYVAEDSTQRARALLPRNANADAASYQRSQQRLQDAAQQDRETLQKLAQLPVSKKRDQAIHEARRALLETQNAMIDIAPDVS